MKLFKNYFVTTIGILFLLLLTMGTTQAQDRYVWRHSSGYFENTSGNNWVESAPSGDRNNFYEVTRTPHYIEIHDVNGVSRVRLYDNHCNVAFRPNWQYATFYYGSWQN